MRKKSLDSFICEREGFFFLELDYVNKNLLYRKPEILIVSDNK